MGSKGIVTEKGNLTGMHSRIDRDEVICTPVPFVDIEDLDTFYKDCKRLHLEFLLAIGLRKNDIVRKLIKEVASD